MLQNMLQKRSNGYYYFRWVYPPALQKLLGKRELIKSLRTTSKPQALARAGGYYVAVDKLKNQNEQVSLDELGFKVVLNKSYTEPLVVRDERNLTSGELDRVDRTLAEMYEKFVPVHFKGLLSIASHYTAPSFLAAKKELAFLDQFLQKYDAPYNSQGEFAEGETIYDVTERLLAMLARIDESVWTGYEHLERMTDDAAYDYVELINFAALGDLANVFRCSEKWYRRFVVELTAVLCHANLTKRERLAPVKPELPSYLLPLEPKVIPVTVKPASILFSELFTQFLLYKQKEEGLSSKMQGDYKDYVKTLLFALGDQPIAEITKRQVKEFLTTYSKLPKRNLKLYMGKPISELWGIDVPEAHRIALKTMTGAKKFLLGIFRYAVNQEFIVISPAKDLDLKVKFEKKRGPFTDSEVRMIFSFLDSDSHIGKHEWQKWAVLLGAYTGARASEIINLLKEDIVRDDETDIWSIVVRGTKTRNALREFPVPPELIEKGFLSFIKGGYGRVFPDDKDGKTITAFFPRIMKKAGVSKLNNKGLTRSFHSFRHTIITKARGASFGHALVQQIVGHEKTGVGITDNYTHDFTMLELLPVVSAIRY